MVYLIDGGLGVQTYTHYNDERKDGLLLGTSNITTWGFKHEDSSAPSYRLRLLSGHETGAALSPGEFMGFLRVPASLKDMTALCLLFRKITGGIEDGEGKRANCMKMLFLEGYNLPDRHVGTARRGESQPLPQFLRLLSQ